MLIYLNAIYNLITKKYIINIKKSIYDILYLLFNILKTIVIFICGIIGFILFCIFYVILCTIGMLDITWLINYISCIFKFCDSKINTTDKFFMSIEQKLLYENNYILFFINLFISFNILNIVLCVNNKIKELLLFNLLYIITIFCSFTYETDNYSFYMLILQLLISCGIIFNICYIYNLNCLRIYNEIENEVHSIEEGIIEIGNKNN